ncbi:hypothetical protein [Polyangium fumosum]|uniref:Uncharacterized protein n=1 Tax=Polyangium fumosum TaxID=889272 RepID=A0A4U1JH06_9BACT|nr:hypothetical protein [Polyangium fumosum]TKD11854.1 hypothetical protein E8A74_06895 [Polyangium fumosum]
MPAGRWRGGGVARFGLFGGAERFGRARGPAAAASGVLLHGPRGAGLALYRFGASAPYVGGLGGNSYSNDFVVSSKSLPTEFERHQKLPAWVVPHLNGKSLNVFMVPPARKASLRQQFDAAYSKR